MILSSRAWLPTGSWCRCKMCRGFGVPRRTIHYQTVKSPPKVNRRLAKSIKARIEEPPSFGYRRMAHQLGFNQDAGQRLFQLQGWQPRGEPNAKDDRLGTLAHALTSARRWRLKPAPAEAIVAKVQDVLAQRLDFFKGADR